MYNILLLLFITYIWYSLQTPSIRNPSFSLGRVNLISNKKCSSVISLYILGTPFSDRLYK